jgi:hypothetical protein
MAKFSASEWGIQTYDLRLAANQLTEANWERIIEKAREFCGIFRKPGSFRAKYASQVYNKKHSGRATIISDDLDDEDSSEELVDDDITASH